MDEQPRSRDRTAFLCGLLAVAMGLFIVLSALGVIPSRGGAQGERWVAVVAGLAFVFGGLAVVIQTWARATPDGVLPASTPPFVRTALYLLTLAIVVSLGAIGTWVAFGPGKREFATSIPFLPGWLNEPLGRTAFGVGAIMTWMILILVAVTGARRLRGPKV
jgi:hypothetical protein